MQVSFTKISDDVLVPTNLLELKDGIPLKYDTAVWYGLGGLWIFAMIVSLKHGLEIITFQAIGASTGIVGLLAMILFVTLKIPFGWIELNKRTGNVTVWTSAKKRRRVAQGKFSDFRIDWTCRRVVTSRYSAEYRYSLGLYPLKGGKKFKKAFLDGKHEVQFCFLYDMETHNSKVPPDNSLEERAEQVARKTEVFLNDFFSSKPLPNRKDNTFSFSA
jgi:hypothetical protein